MLRTQDGGEGAGRRRSERGRERVVGCERADTAERSKRVQRPPLDFVHPLPNLVTSLSCRASGLSCPPCPSPPPWISPSSRISSQAPRSSGYHFDHARDSAHCCLPTRRVGTCTGQVLPTPTRLPIGGLALGVTCHTPTVHRSCRATAQRFLLACRPRYAAA